MAHGLRMLIVTTDEDSSLKLFYDPKNIELLNPVKLSYTSSDKELTKIFRTAFDFVYFRDPFNDKRIDQDSARATTNRVINRYDSAYKVDRISSYVDMCLEDKWHQYQLFAKHMPHTSPLESLSLPSGNQLIAKKRISARSRDIIFAEGEFPKGADAQDYIVQPMLKIEKEYRVYMVGGKIIKPVAVRASKTPSTKAKLTGLKGSISPDVVKICRSIYETTKFDLIGIDIAKTASGYLLLEVNRSCQFGGYFRLTNINLAVLLSEYLMGVKPTA